MRNWRRWTLVLAILVAVLGTLTSAEQKQKHVKQRFVIEDAYTGEPGAGLEVTVVALSCYDQTDKRGRFDCDFPSGRSQVVVEAWVPGTTGRLGVDLWRWAVQIDIPSHGRPADFVLQQYPPPVFCLPPFCRR